MRKLFIQFYLLLFVCFLVMTLLVGLVYKFTAERAGRQSMNDLMASSLFLMRSELREIPPRDWNKNIRSLDLDLSFCTVWAWPSTRWQRTSIRWSPVKSS